MPSIFVTNIQPSDILSSFYGSALLWIIIGILTAIWAQSKKALLPFILKHFGKIPFVIMRWLLNCLASIYLRFGIIILFLVFINLDKENSLWYSITILIFSLSILWKPKKISSFFDPVAKFSDNFDDEKTLTTNWTTKTGEPKIDKTFGKPAPDLELKRFVSQATNSFLWLNDVDARSGVVECDFNLEKDALFNIVFFGNNNNDNWYMARFDSRGKASDGFCIKDGGPGNNWRHFVSSGTRTEPRKWFRARLEFNDREVKMYRDGELIAEFKGPNIFGSKIGIFNEVNDVHVDNFLFIESD